MEIQLQNLITIYQMNNLALNRIVCRILRRSTPKAPPLSVVGYVYISTVRSLNVPLRNKATIGQYRTIIKLSSHATTQSRI